MYRAIDVAGDVVAAGSALAGLMLVYMGALSTSFASFQPQERKSVRGSHLKRTWFAFAGLVLFVAAVSGALIGKLFAIPCLAVAALGLLLIGCGWLIATAIFTAREIK
jgi:hypothetical protein